MKLAFFLVLSVLALAVAQKTSTKPKTTTNPRSTQNQTTKKGKPTAVQTTTTMKAKAATTPKTKTENNDKGHFENWKKTNHKVYSNQAEEKQAAKNYAKTEKAISDHNKKKNVSYKQGTNENSDMTYDQKKATKMGAKKNTKKNKSKRSLSMGRFKRDGYSTPPPPSLNLT